MIQKINLVLSSLALIGIVVVLVGRDSSDGKIAYIETRKLVENYKEMKPITLEYQKKAQELQKRINTLNTEFEAEIKKYEQERKDMSLEEQARREQQLSKRQGEIKNYQERVQKDMSLQDSESIQNVVKEINNFILEYGKEHNYHIILAANGDNLAYADDALDITDELIAALNNQN